MNPFLHDSRYFIVKKLADQLMQHGYSVYLAGGCVRDALLGRLPKDYDIATNATPEQIEALFLKTVAVGKQFGIIVVIEEGLEIEVATFRSDGHYQDGRHPDKVHFSTPEQDAERRDFTINAMFFDFKTQTLVDFVGGQTDLKSKTIRAVGEPRARFLEDHLRMLRAIRFACELDFSIENNTLEAIKSHSPSILKVSHERIRDELCKSIQGDFFSQHFHLFIELEIMNMLLPELKWDLDLVKTYVRPLDKYQASAFIALLSMPIMNMPTAGHVSGYGEWHIDQELKQKLESIVERFRFSRIDKRLISFCLLHLDLFKHLDKLRPGYTAYLRYSEFGEKLCMWASLLYKKQFPQLQKIEALGPQTCYLSGEDVLQQGITKGPRVAELLKECLYLQYEQKIVSADGARQWLSEKVRSKQ